MSANMAEPKPFASLSSGLLARKGGAKPAMRPQAYHFGDPVEDLGWNDMGHANAHAHAHAHAVLVPAVEAAPAPNPVALQHEEIVESFSQPKREEPERAAIVAAPQPSVRAVPGSKQKAAFTLRLDKERHLQLRLACALQHRSAQQVVSDALDTFLAGMPELAAAMPKASNNS